MTKTRDAIPPVIETDTVDEPIVRPSKRWRNKYECTSAYKDGAFGQIADNQVVWGDVVYPSKELAEEDHFKFLHSGRTPGGFDYAVTRGVMLWLGAYPSPD